jgi:hypothetical protein
VRGCNATTPRHCSMDPTGSGREPFCRVPFRLSPFHSRTGSCVATDRIDGHQTAPRRPVPAGVNSAPKLFPMWRGGGRPARRRADPLAVLRPRELPVGKEQSRPNEPLERKRKAQGLGGEPSISYCRNRNKGSFSSSPKREKEGLRF